MNHHFWLKVHVSLHVSFTPPKPEFHPTDDSTCIGWAGGGERTFAEIAKPAPGGHTIQRMGWGGGRPLVDTLEATARAKGVEVVVDARVMGLIEDKGRIVGLVVRIDNQNRFVRARKGVVLATGGLVMNEEKRRKYSPETFKITTPIGDKDDAMGIQPGRGDGGEAGHMEQVVTTCPWKLAATV